MSVQPFRLDPAMPVGAYQTFSVSAPRDHFVQAACEQVLCEARQFGWETVINEATVQGQTQAAYIRQQSGRTYTESRTGAGLTVFRFASGQRCFAPHQTRPERYLVHGGDWRQNLGLIRRHVRPADWVEDFGEHQQRIADQHEKG